MTPEDWLRFVQLPPFPSHWASLGLGEEDLRDLESQLVSNPTEGRVIRGGGGLRKSRFRAASSDRGKRGSFRVFYVFFPRFGTILQLATIGKTEQADLIRNDLKAIASLIQRIQHALEAGEIR